MNPRMQQGFDADGLQADVMRFMAIIAFCLIAIMTLVREIPAPPVNVPVAPENAPEANEPVSMPPAEQVPDEPVVAVPPAVPSAPVGEVTEPEPEASPLTLQFASDQAFIRLIANDRIRLFAQQDDGFMQLTTAFATRPADVHGELYEVLAGSLPVRVTRLFPDAALFLVRLPAETASQLKTLQQAHADRGGRLVIDATGRVSHEE